MANRAAWSFHEVRLSRTRSKVSLVGSCFANYSNIRTYLDSVRLTMIRISSAALIAAILMSMPGGALAQNGNSDSEAALVAKAEKIHKDVITLDTHDDINTANFTETVNYTQELSTQVTLPKMRKGGLDVAWFIVYTGQGPLTEEGYSAAYRNAIDKFDSIERLTKTI